MVLIVVLIFAKNVLGVLLRTARTPKHSVEPYLFSFFLEAIDAAPGVEPHFFFTREGFEFDSPALTH